MRLGGHQGSVSPVTIILRVPDAAASGIRSSYQYTAVIR